MMRQDRFTEAAQEVLAALRRHPEPFGYAQDKLREGSGGGGCNVLTTPHHPGFFAALRMTLER